MPQYTSFRVKRETYQKLRKTRDKFKLDSIDEAIMLLLMQHEIINSQNNVRQSS